MAQRWILHPASAFVSQPCLELRSEEAGAGLMTLIDEFSRRCLAIYVAAASIDMNTGHITTPDCCNEGAE